MLVFGHARSGSAFTAGVSSNPPSFMSEMMVPSLAGAAAEYRDLRNHGAAGALRCHLGSDSGTEPMLVGRSG